MNKHRIILLLLSITYIHSMTAGFVAGTLIKLGPTSRRIRYIPIEQLKERKFICSYDLNETIVERIVTQIIKKRVGKYIRIEVDDHQIDASEDQLFFAPLEFAWLQAKELTPGMCLLKGTNKYVFIDDVIEIDQEVDVYEITVQHYHNFYVSEYDIVVHNFIPIIAIGIVGTFGGGIEISGIYGAVAAAGVILGGLLSKNHTQELNQPLPGNRYTAETIIAYQPSHSDTPINLMPAFPSASSMQEQIVSNNYPRDCFNRAPDYQSSLITQSELNTNNVLFLMGKNKDYKKPKQENNNSFSASGDPNDEDPRNNNNKQNDRKINKITKTEFFKKLKGQYEHWHKKIYKKNSNADGIEGAEYLEWDHRHQDIEAYDKNGRHLGSIDPETGKFYKPAVPNRWLSI